MKVVKLSDCCISHSTVTQAPIFTTVFVIVDENSVPIWHENLFLIEAAKEFDANTCRAYANDLLSFTRMNRPLGGWRAVTNSVMNGYFVGDLIQCRHFSESSVIRHTCSIKKFFIWLFKKGYLTSECDFNWNYKKYFAAQVDRQLINSNHTSHHSSYLSTSNYDLLLSHVKARSSFIRARDRICLQLGYLTGTRACETLRINAYQLIRLIEKARAENQNLWATTSYDIIGKRNKRRPLEIPPKLCEEICSYISRFAKTFLSRDSSLICHVNGKKIRNEKHASYVFSRAYLEANLVRTGHQGYHSLRKSFATNLVSKCHKIGLDPWVVVPRRLGHTNIETTFGYIFFEAVLNGRSKLLSELRMAKHRGLRYGN